MARSTYIYIILSVHPWRTYDKQSLEGAFTVKYEMVEKLRQLVLNGESVENFEVYRVRDNYLNDFKSSC